MLVLVSLAGTDVRCAETTVNEMRRTEVRSIAQEDKENVKSE